MSGLLQQLLARVPESMRTRLVRASHPRLAYMLMGQTAPISTVAGVDRGQRIDQLFTDRFLRESASFIRGACLEAKSGHYAGRFGQASTRVDVLDLDRTNPQATVFGDLRRLDAVADATYDCVILSHVLHRIDDLDAAVRETARILRPGGTALVTLPGVQRLDGDPSDCWRFTLLSARYVFGKQFGEAGLDVRTWGNVLTSSAAWVGLAQEDLKPAHFEEHDPAYPCVVSVRATKSG